LGIYAKHVAKRYGSRIEQIAHLHALTRFTSWRISQGVFARHEKQVFSDGKQKIFDWLTAGI
jgi:hypothetical protein